MVFLGNLHIYKESFVNIAGLFTVFLPLLSALFAVTTSKILSSRAISYVSCALIFISSCAACYIFYQILLLQHPAIRMSIFQWMEIRNVSVWFAIYLDSLTAIMLVVVSVISLLVHIFSIEYMSMDQGRARFMCYISLFTFFMMVLVSSSSFLQMFFGWEGVGLCSYLLVGFWFTKVSASKAATKAFTVNRIADVFFVLALLIIFDVFGSFEFHRVFSLVPSFINHSTAIAGIEFSSITLIGFLLMVACMAKSAQIGLHVWLPDAMEGPTPASALIHAATMVTAGIFLLVRCSYIMEYSGIVLHVVTVIGVMTALLTAFLAMVQDDIKKVIAYSTCSQLGYMFFACGLSNYSAALFHLFTHAFFKALLFLGAGSVIYSLNHLQDMRKMGGLRRDLPFTHYSMLIASLSLSGIAFFSGFFSKDLIIELSYANGSVLGYCAYGVGVFVAFLTAFYSWRLVILVFYGEGRYNNVLESGSIIQRSVKEETILMKSPMIILALFSTFIGGACYLFLNIGDANNVMWRGVLFVRNYKVQEAAGEVSWYMHYVINLLPMIASVAGIMVAYAVYMFDVNLRINITTIRRLLSNKYYFDLLYDKLVLFLKKVATFLSSVVDTYIIDGAVVGISRLVVDASAIVSRCHTGYVYHYIVLMLCGVIMMLYVVVM